MNLYQVLEALERHEASGLLDCPVQMIVGGIAYPVQQVWFERMQCPGGAVCIGDDPR